MGQAHNFQEEDGKSGTDDVGAPTIEKFVIQYIIKQSEKERSEFE